jgi:hypothetical protein
MSPPDGLPPLSSGSAASTPALCLVTFRFARDIDIYQKVLRFTQNQRSAAQLDGFIDIVDNEKRSFAGFADEVEKVLA